MTKEADMTLEEMQRKGSWLRRHYANPRFALVDDKGEPTRFALQAQAWGERLPKTDEDVKKLADKGTKLLEEYHQLKDGDGAAAKKDVSKTSGKSSSKTTPKSTSKSASKK